MDSTVWGPHLWFYLHTISFNYPEKPLQEEKNNYYNFFYSLTKTLPCIFCRNHYTEFFNQNPIRPHLDTTKNLILWVLKCHNNVNKLHNKPEWTFEQLDAYYKKKYIEEPIEQYTNNNNNNNNKECPFNKYKLSISVSLIIIIVLIVVLKKYNKI